MKSNEPNESLTLEHKLKLWEKYEDVAMHFNGLIMQVRTRALGGVTAILALSGVAVNFASGPTTAEQWDVIFGTLVFLIFAWIAIAILDLFYYHSLLLGAIDALLDLEKETDVQLSQSIERRFRRRRKTADGENSRPVLRWFSERPWPFTFYTIGLVALVLGVITTKCVSLKYERIEQEIHQPLNVNIDRESGDKINLTVEPK